MKLKTLAVLASFTCLTTPAFALQSAPADAADEAAADDKEAIIVTGSRIKRLTLAKALSFARLLQRMILVAKA